MKTWLLAFAALLWLSGASAAPPRTVASAPSLAASASAPGLVPAPAAASVPVANAASAAATAPAGPKPSLLATLNLGRVELAAVIQVVYGEMLRQPFFLDARVKSEPITLSFRGASPEAAARVLDEYLKSVHISRVVREGVNVFVPAADSSSQSSTDSPGAIASMASSAASKASTFVERTGSIEDAEPEVGEVVRLRYRKPEELQKLVSAVCKNVVPGDEGFFVMCPPAKVEMVRRIVSAFDVQSNEVLVKAAVIEYSDSKDAGAGLFGAVKALGGLLQVSIGAPAVGANYIGIKSSTVEALLSVASGDSRFNVVHQSTLRVASGKGGRLQVGQDVPILGAVTVDKTGASIQSVSYRNTGLVVSVKPSLIGDRVQAELEHSVSSFAVTNSSKIDSPTFLRKR